MSTERNKKIIKTSIIGIIVNLILVLFKASIGILVNSIAIILDAINNLTDALSSIITIIGTKLAERRPDKKHPFGYGRIEYFSSLIIAIIILFAGLTALQESIPKIFHPVTADYTFISILIITIAVIVKFLLGRYVKKVGEEINSQSLIASGSDALFDSILSLSTVIAAIISITWHISIEGILGTIIAIIIIKAAIEILRDTVNSMIGTRADKKLADKLKAEINAFNNVLGTYDLILHNYGPTQLIGSAHIEVPDSLTANDIHALTRGIILKIYNDYGIILTIGIYASNTDDPEHLKIKEELMEIIEKYSGVIQVHGFFVDQKVKLVTFDIIFDFIEENPDKIKNKILSELKDLNPTYTFHAILDRDFSE